MTRKQYHHRILVMNWWLSEFRHHHRECFAARWPETVGDVSRAEVQARIVETSDEQQLRRRVAKKVMATASNVTMISLLLTTKGI